MSWLEMDEPMRFVLEACLKEPKERKELLDRAKDQYGEIMFARAQMRLTRKKYIENGYSLTPLGMETITTIKTNEGIPVST